ncbi:putative metal-binding motif-containing protein, partial [Myxococcota bacterium]|nr:putative metal-binding motif-containing protein [Myxococcota bacterium]
MPKRGERGLGAGAPLRYKGTVFKQERSVKRALFLFLLFGCGEEAEFSPRPDVGPRPDAAPAPCLDEDGDGYGEGVTCQPDCDDANYYANPGEAEVCDGVDNNCDGQVDEGLEGAGPACTLTQGLCAGRQRSCIAGAWAACRFEDYGPQFEPDEYTCDAIDNDCDGFIDEGCPCTPGETQPCGSVIGVCGGGQQTCLQGGFWSGCEGGVEASQELCDGLDNDCDGETDEGVEPQPCPKRLGVCAGSTRACDGGDWPTCGAHEYGPRWVEEEGADHCDGFDNDCDGQIDEVCGCRIGDTQPCGGELGVCRVGEQTCVDGLWSECRGGIEPQLEVCDGFDNDCDGQTDEGLSAPPCPLTQGVCTGAVQTCAGRDGWAACTPISYSRHDPRYAPDEGADHCDGLDNDCDGLVDEVCECDEGATQPCGESVGACTQGEQTCVGGRWAACSGQGPAEEICDSVDNDCDGAVDESLVGPRCAAQAGVCANATQRCVGGAWAACAPQDFGARYEAEEVSCDGLDNDCDGEIDEACDCRPSEIQRCGEAVGQCSPGLQTCVNGAWSVCEGAVGPLPEVCDGLDNDCDGERDEGLSGPACPLSQGVCAGATRRCVGASGWAEGCDGADYGVQYAATEGADHCDGLDNDCDGLIDEGCECQPDG